LLTSIIYFLKVSVFFLKFLNFFWVFDGFFCKIGKKMIRHDPPVSIREGHIRRSSNDSSRDALILNCSNLSCLIRLHPSYVIRVHPWSRGFHPDRPVQSRLDYSRYIQLFFFIEVGALICKDNVWEDVIFMGTSWIFYSIMTMMWCDSAPCVFVSATVSNYHVVEYTKSIWPPFS
jgi:hypothetical protein